MTKNKRDLVRERSKELLLLSIKYTDLIAALMSPSMNLTEDQRMIHINDLLVKFLEEAGYLQKIIPPLLLDLDDTMTTSNQPE